MIPGVVLHEGDQPNVLTPNFNNARKLAQKELEVNMFAQTVVTVHFLRMKCTQFNCKWLS